MNYYGVFEDDENFYDEPNEFYQQIDEFKQSLLKNVKDEYKTEMERLKAENAELQEVKKNFEQIKQDYRSKERQLEIDKSNLSSTVRRERLSALMKDFEVIMYDTTTKRVKGPKCDKCDQNRVIHYKTPTGKDAREECECNRGRLVYVPDENICSEFKINRDGNAFSAHYKMKPNGDYDYASLDVGSTFCSKVYHDGDRYEDLKRHGTFFKSKEECQKYCDWLTEQEENIK